MNACTDCTSNCASICTGSSTSSNLSDVKTLLASVYNVQLTETPSIVNDDASNNEGASTQFEDCGCGSSCYTVCGGSCVSSVSMGGTEIIENESKNSSLRIVTTKVNTLGLSKIRSSNLINKMEVK